MYNQTVNLKHATRNGSLYLKRTNNGEDLMDYSTEMQRDSAKLPQDHLAPPTNIVWRIVSGDFSHMNHRAKYGVSLFYCTMVLALCRICRKWNQTGDKWSQIPDIGDWLIRPDNKDILTAVSAVSLTLACLIMTTRCQLNLHWSQRLLFYCGAFSVFNYRLAIGDLSCASLSSDASPSKGVVEARLAYACALLSLLIGICRAFLVKSDEVSRSRDLKCSPHSGGFRVEMLYSSVYSAFVIVTLLLMRPHNITLVTMELLMLWLSSNIFRILDITDVVQVTGFYLWMGQASFFYQGNSNSIATIDVSSGYVGVTDYWPPVIGVLMCLSVYSAPILWHMGMVINLLQRHKHTKELVESMEQSVKVTVWSRALLMSVYVMLISLQRYHLFVWTVFSPKLLYEGMFTLVTVILQLLLLFANSYNRRTTIRP